MVRSLRSRVLTVLIVATLSFLIVAVSASAVLTFSDANISPSDIVSDRTPDISGRYIVWERWNPGLTDWDIICCDRQTMEHSYPTDDGDADQRYPRVSGDRIVWIDLTEADGEVYYDDLDDGDIAHRITTDTAVDVSPDIDGNYIVWMNGTGPGRDIRWYDIETDSYGTVPGTNVPNGVRIDKGRIVYYDDHASATWGVYVYDIERDTEYTVTTVSAATTTIRETDIHGDNVAWSQYQNATPSNVDIFAEDTRSDESVQVTFNGGSQSHPSTWGDVLAWQDDRNASDDIFAWWRPELGAQDVSIGVYDEVLPSVFGHTVVYQHYATVPATDYDVGMSVAPLAAQRLAGPDRYATAAAISKDNFSAAGTIVIATGEDFPDALAASALAGAYRAPLLLTRVSAIPAIVTAEIERLGATHVVLVGGESAIAGSVEGQLDDMSLSHERISGANRYATAKQIAYRVMDMEESSGTFRQEAFFVRGDDFADALSVAPHAYARRMPILLVKPGEVPADTRDAIQFTYLTHGYVIGGTSAVSEPTYDDIEDLIAANPGSTGLARWDGDTRYETALYCAWEGVSEGWLDWDSVGVATGQNFPDALGGGAACGAYGSPIVLTPSASVSADVDSFMTDMRYDFGGMEVYGGTSAVSNAVFAEFAGYLN